MENPRDRQSDTEDIPSDFFDDFNKEEFMEGLSVIDSWDDADGRKRRGSRINAEDVENVKDLRELIRDGKEGDNGDASERLDREHGSSSAQRRSASRTRLDDYIKPGSRRDPSKTNEAIKRDKEVKVKEHLAKQLESVDDLRPPGTELDDFFDGAKPQERKVVAEPLEEPAWSKEPRRESPGRTQWRSREHREQPRRSPQRHQRRSPRRSPKRSPHRAHRHSPRHLSPLRRNFDRRPRVQPYNSRRSPRYSPKRSPRHSPRRSPRWERRSRSPMRASQRRPLSKPDYHKDSFLYPGDSPTRAPSYAPDPYQMGMGAGGYPGPGPNDYPSPGFSYPQTPAYPVGYNNPYDYGGVSMPPVGQLVPQPVPAPALNPVPAPAMVPAPLQMSSAQPINIPLPPSNTPYDALAQLVADGKLSQEDYMKLAPNKGKTAGLHGQASTFMDTKARVEVLKRCNVAIAKLMTLRVPNRLIMNTNLISQDLKSLAPKFCSPLKRQAAVEFHFTTASGSSSAQHNKQLIDSIINTVGLNKVIARPKRNAPKNMKDAAVQTTKPYCDVCEIRETTKCYDTATSVDPEHFSSSVHTQVIEQELASSKSVFNPSGSVGSAPISIAHLTPAQLVSQLAARAKTLKQTDPAPPNQWRGQQNNYDYDNRGGGQQYQNNYSNYRY